MLKTLFFFFAVAYSKIFKRLCKVLKQLQKLFFYVVLLSKRPNPTGSVGNKKFYLKVFSFWLLRCEPGASVSGKQQIYSSLVFINFYSFSRLSLVNLRREIYKEHVRFVSRLFLSLVREKIWLNQYFYYMVLINKNRGLIWFFNLFKFHKCF